MHEYNAHFKYLIGGLMSLPLLPILYLQGKKIRAQVPKLPDAKNPQGVYGQSIKGQKLNILILGESTMAGVGVKTHQEGFAGNFAKRISQLYHQQTIWKVFAKSGLTAKELTNKLYDKNDSKEYDLIIIGLGANDAFMLNSPWRWKKQILKLINQLINNYPNAEIVFASTPPIKEFPAFTKTVKFVVGNLVEILESALILLIRDFKKVHYFGEINFDDWAELYDLTDLNPFFSDGIHPSKFSYEIWSTLLANKIHELELLKT